MNSSKIRIIAIGGAGIATLNDFDDDILENAECVALDTDEQAVINSKAHIKISLIENGEGTGLDTTIAKQALSEHLTEIDEISSNAKTIIIISGLGGGTASIVTPIISKIISEKSQSTLLAFSILPMSVEGEQKQKLARKSKNYLNKRCNANFVLPNDIILSKLNQPIANAFKSANKNIANAVKSLVNVLTYKGLINIDFPTLNKILTKTSTSSLSFICNSKASGFDAINDASLMLLQSPLLPADTTAENLLIMLRCSPNFEMNKMQELLESSANKLGYPKNLAFGVYVDESLTDSIEVTAMGICKTKEIQEETVAQKTEVFENSTPEQNATQPEEIENISSEEQNPNPIQPPISYQTPEKPPVLAEVEDKSKKRTFSLFRRNKRAKAKKPQPEVIDKQTEFAFVELEQQRGFFNETPPNIRNGVDLDVPTFMRKGITIII